MTGESFLNGKVILHSGDCLDVIPTLAANSVDACVCDPPYGLNFMGRAWDHGVPGIPYWKALLRILKPGGHLVAFSGTRTYHRMACAIEDAGFEVREMLQYLYGSGFPKSLNVSKRLEDAQECCTCDESVRSVRRDLDASQSLSGNPQQDVLTSVCCGEHQPQQQGHPLSLQSPDKDQLQKMWRAARDSSGLGGEEGPEKLLLQPILPREGGVRTGVDTSCSQGPSGLDREQHDLLSRQNDGADQPSMEGRSDLPEAPRQLREREVCPLPTGVSDDGADGRLRDGTSPGDGEVGRPVLAADRVCAPHRPSTIEQPALESGALAGQPQPQKRGAWDHCRRCGKPIIPDGLGTALKPAVEPICLARKPLEGTVAANILRWGTGAINIDGCRVATDEQSNRAGGRRPTTHEGYQRPGATMYQDKTDWSLSKEGRWPANIIHDGSDEVVGAFPESDHARGNTSPTKRQASGGVWAANGSQYGIGQDGATFAGDSGSAARFFYTAKADADDRLGSKHPTVKPLDLMQWLVRLVTPKGGLVLDIFAGTGTTGEAAWREGMRAVLIERETEYQNDIRRRMAHALAGPQERKRTIAKAKHGSQPFTDGLFAAMGDQT